MFSICCFISLLFSAQYKNDTMSDKLKQGDKAWDARCDKSGASIRVKPENLRAATNDTTSTSRGRRATLDPGIGDTFKSMVRGRADEACSQIGTGQITRMTFETLVDIATELYSEASEAEVVAMAIDFIGKEGDSELVFDSFKTRIQQPIGGYHILRASQRFDMDTAAKVSMVMLNARKGTLAYIESQQALMRIMLPKLRTFKIKSDSRESYRVFCELDDSKCRRRTHMTDELIRAAFGGEVMVAGVEGIKTVEVSELMHRHYVHWLIEDVLPTLKPSDAKKGSLGEWHLIKDWERQLISSIEVTPTFIMLDIADSFSIESWLNGFISFDLSTLEDMPGVDVDRRIARLAFFADLAFDASVATGDLDNNFSDELNVPSSSTPTPRASLQLWKEGANVVVVNKDAAVNGMEGHILCATEPGRYMVSFSNLENAVEIDASNLQDTQKVEREHHFCVCGNKGTLLCGRCSRIWYCGKACQVSDHKTHDPTCKALLSKDPMTEMMRLAKVAREKVSADE
jgi:hypothetical protein